MRQSRCAVLVAIVALAAPASATIVVLKDNGEPATPEEASLDYNAATGGWTITLIDLYAPAADTVYEVHADGGETIDNLYIDVPCWESGGECIPAGSPLLIRVYGNAPEYLTAIHNIEQRGTAETILVEIAGVQDVGRVQAEVIGRIVADRDVIGPIISTTPDHASRGVFWVDAARDVLGDVRAEQGRIGLVRGQRQVGRPGKPIEIIAKHGVNGVLALAPECMFAWDDGMPIDCAGDIHANILTRANGGAGHVKQIFARAFYGTLSAERFHPDPTMTEVRFVFLEEFHGEVWLARSLTRQDAYIELPFGGMHGQIVLNGSNGSEAAWGTPIYVGHTQVGGQVLLDGPNYTMPASTLGGGSVGLVPFGLHTTSSEPPGGGVLAGATPSDRVVALRFYGPITLAEGTPVIIARRATGSGAAFTPVSTSVFAIGVRTSDSRVLEIAAGPGGTGFEAGYDYRIDPGPGLRCDTSDQPSVGWTGGYVISVATTSTCPADVDGSGIVDLLDLLRVLVDWGPSSGSSGDLTGDGVVDFHDLLAVLASWGPCP